MGRPRKEQPEPKEENQELQQEPKDSSQRIVGNSAIKTQ